MRLGRHLGLVLLRLVLTRAHVPTYGVGADNCFTPPHTHTTSQVIYLKGSGGLEIHIKSNTDPFDIAGGEILDVDAVFKYEYDQTTYDLFIGCGGCVATVDPLVEPRQALVGYQHGEVEPFTQSFYRSVFAKADRKYDSEPARRLHREPLLHPRSRLPQPHRGGARDARVGRGHRHGRDVHAGSS